MRRIPDRASIDQQLPAARVAQEGRLSGQTVMRFWLVALPCRPFCGWTIVASLAAAILLGIPTQGQADGPSKRVLMLHSFGLRFKPWTDHARIARSEITRQSQTPVDFQDHSLR